VKVYLLPLAQRQSFFYFEDDAGETGTVPPQPGLRGWAERTAHRLRSSVRHPKGRLGQKLRQGWDWLQRRLHPDEPLLAALLWAPRVDVHHPSSLPAAEAGALWDVYLQRRVRRHIPWLLFNGALAPLSVVLALLPGPNIIGYWFAYRAVRHLLILLGICRVRRGRVATKFHAIDGLDCSGDCGDVEWRTRAVQRYALFGLHDFVARMAPEPAAVTDAAAGDESQASRRA
jgi:hypothetical protein